MDDVTRWVLGSVLGLLFGIISFFLKRLIGQNDKILSQVSTHSTHIQLLAQKLTHIEDAAKDVLVMKEELKDLREDHGVLERNQQTIFRKMDELRDELVELANLSTALDRRTASQHTRTVYLVQKLTKLRAYLEKANVINITEDPWMMPDE